MAAILIIACAAFVLALLIADYQERRRLAWIFKPLASLAFVGFALQNGALETGYGQLILLGLVFCLAGDVLLIARAQIAFLIGMSAFALGHLAYAAAFLQSGGVLSAVTIVGGGAVSGSIFFALRWLWPHLGAFRYPVVVYCLIIGLMIIASLEARPPGGETARWLVYAGAIGFAISDISVARDQFVRKVFFNRLWGLPLYFASQLLLAASVSQ